MQGFQGLEEIVNAQAVVAGALPLGTVFAVVLRTSVEERSRPFLKNHFNGLLMCVAADQGNVTPAACNHLRVLFHNISPKIR